jgi:hypothetical protein
MFLASTLAALMTGAVLAQSEPKEARKAQNAGAGVLPLETILQKSVELYPGGRVVEPNLTTI